MQGNNYPYQNPQEINPGPMYQGASVSYGSSSSNYKYDMPPPGFSSDYSDGGTNPYPMDSSSRSSYGDGGQFGGQSSFGSNYGNQGSYSQDSLAGGGGNYSGDAGSFSYGSGSAVPSQGGMDSGVTQALKRLASAMDDGASPMKKNKTKGFQSRSFYNKNSGGSFGNRNVGEYSGGTQRWGSGTGSWGAGARGGQQGQFHGGGGQGGSLGSASELVEDLSGCTLEQLHLALKLVKQGVGSTPSAASSASPGLPFSLGQQQQLRGRSQGWGNQSNFGQQRQGNQPFGSSFRNWGRGQGQNFFVAGGRGGKAQQPPVDPSPLSREERLKRFCQYLQRTPSKVNDIQTLENALTATHLNLQTEFQCEELLRMGSKVFFTAALSLSGFFLARSVGGSKKEVKRDAYQQALRYLKTMNFNKLSKLKDKGVDAVKKELEASFPEKGKEEKGKEAKGKEAKGKEAKGKGKEEKAAESGKPAADASSSSASDQTTSSTGAASKPKSGGGAKTSAPGQPAASTASSASAGTSGAAVSLLDQIQNLGTYLKTSTGKFDNKICEMTAALKATKSSLQHDVEFEEVRINGLPHFKVTLRFDGMPIAHSSGNSKKLAKARAFEKAFQALTTKSASEIIAGVPEEFDLPPEEPAAPKPSKAKKNTSANKAATPMETDSPQETKGKKGAPPPTDPLDKFTMLRDKLATLDLLPKDLVNAVDTAAGQLGIIPTCIYSRPAEGRKSHCDLFLDDLFMAAGDADNRRESQLQAYSKAWEQLKTISPQTLLTINRRLKPEDRTAPGVQDVCVKGQAWQEDSNLRHLQGLGATDEDLAQPTGNLVFMEHGEWINDRRHHAFPILSKSATWCKMLLSWSIEPYQSFFKCEMKLQGQSVGQAYSRSKNEARSLAAADAVFKMYQTQPVIKVAPNKKDSLYWIETEKVYEQVKELEALADEPATAPAQEGDTPREEQVSPYFTQTIEKYILDFVKKNTLDELIFGIGMTVPERREIQRVAKEWGLRFHNRHQKQSNYIVVFMDRRPQEIAEALKKNPSSCHKFSLEDPAQLPQHKDIENLLLSREQVDTLLASGQ